MKTLQELVENYKQNSTEELFNEILENSKKIFHSVLHRQGVFSKNKDYEEIYSLLQFALYRTLNKYDINKNTKFTTYLYSTLANEVKLFYRTQGKHKESNTSMYTVITQDTDKVELWELLEDEDSLSSYNNIEHRDTISKFLNQLSELDKKIFIGYYFNDKKQKEIGNELNLKQITICRRMQRAIERYRIKNKI